MFLVPYPPPPGLTPPHPPTLLLIAGHECKFASPFDTNGVFHHIGTNGDTETYKNPHDSGEVVAKMSSIHVGDPARLVEHDGRTVNYTNNDANSWVSVDLGKGRSLVPSNYCLRHGYHGNGLFRLRSWDFEGSNDDNHWTVLRAYKNDNSLPDQGFSVAAWKVEGVNQAYRYFRIMMTGNNSHGPNHTLCCAGIELYGRLLSR
jgi:hypothetical protein